MRKILVLAALGVGLVALPALAGDQTNGIVEYDIFGCVTPKLQAGEGETFSLNFVPFGKLELNNLTDFVVEALNREWGPPPTLVCGQIFAPTKGAPFDPPARILAQRCGPATPEAPFMIETPLLFDVDQAYGRLKVMQPVRKQECQAGVYDPGANGGTVIVPEPDKCEPIRYDIWRANAMRVRGTGALNVNEIYPAAGAATTASTHIECRPLPKKKIPPYVEPSQ